MGDRIAAGAALTPNTRITSANGAYFVILQTDGNLVLYTRDGRAVWATDTPGSGGVRFEMQTDGNLVLYNAGRGPLWATNTNGNAGAFAVIQNDGNFVVYRGSSALWSSDTVGGQKAGGGGLFHAIANFVGGAVHAAESAGASIIHATGEAAHVVGHALGSITNNPLWSIVKTGASIVPGLGAVSAGMAVVAGVGKGLSGKDPVIQAARVALPTALQSALDVGVGLADHPELGKALPMVRKDLGNSAELSTALNMGVLLGQKAGVTRNQIDAFKKQLPRNATGQKLEELFTRALAQRKNMPRPNVKLAIQMPPKPATAAQLHVRAASLFPHLHRLDARIQRKDPKAMKWLDAVKVAAKKGDKKSAGILKALDLTRKHKASPHAVARKVPPKVTRVAGETVIEVAGDVEIGSWYLDHPVHDGAGFLAHTYYKGEQAELAASNYGGPRKGNWFFSRPAA